MNYYKIAIIGNLISPLTYKSETLLKEGDLVLVFLRNSQKQAVVIEKVTKPSFKCKDILEKLPLFYSKQQLLCADFIYKYYISSIGESLKLFTPFLRPFKKSEEFIEKKPLYLSSEQKKAIDFIDKNSQTLLFGDTGSGKTEIYIYQMKKILKNGGNIVFLMPEISLTPQMQKRLSEHFGSLVAIYHSKVSKKGKQDILKNVQNGKVRIVAGARSALFLPLRNISLIIVDEEHDESYKSSSNPRYNAKDISLVYGKILNAKVLLGSATPSLASFEKIPTFRLKGTFYKSKKSYVFENSQNEITPNLISYLHEVLQNKKQAIIFVPTRANFKYLTCKSCSYTIKCPYCDVGMSLHSSKFALKCHYCNYTSVIPKVCPNCKDDMLEANRIGTVEIAKNIREIFPKSIIGVFDKDAVKTETNLKKILKDFNDKNIDILVGTQMLSKGHDYQDVALSVILGLDNILNQPDFKAREKALSLAIQIAGRSGRKGEGRVYMQTKNEEFFSLYMKDFEKFLLNEREYRKELYPPFKRLLRVMISHKNETICQDITNDLVSLLKTKDVELVGYGKSNLTKIANKYRYEILLRSKSATKLIEAAFCLKMPNVQIDMDPLSFS